MNEPYDNSYKFLIVSNEFRCHGVSILLKASVGKIMLDDIGFYSRTKFDMYRSVTGYIKICDVHTDGSGILGFPRLSVLCYEISLVDCLLNLAQIS